MARKETYDQAFKRWDRIFDGIKKGLSAEAIYSREDEIERQRIEFRANKRGERSEKNFEEAVRKLECVVDINKTKKYSPEDWNLKVDAWVTCEFNDYGVLVLAVQVKSSEVGINQFLKKYIDKDRVRAWETLHKFGMIVINCQQTPAEIRREFLKQVTEIREANPRGV